MKTHIEIEKFDEVLLGADMNLLKSYGLTPNAVSNLRKRGCRTVKCVFKLLNAEKVNLGRSSLRLDILESGMPEVLHYLLESILTSKYGGWFVQRISGATLAGIGAKQGKTRERVRQVIESADQMIGYLLKPLVEAKKAELKNRKHLYSTDFHSLLLDMKHKDVLDYFLCKEYPDIYRFEGKLNKQSKKTDRIIREGLRGICKDLCLVEDVEKETKEFLALEGIDEGCLDIQELYEQQDYVNYGGVLLRRRASISLLLAYVVKVHYPNGIAIHDPLVLGAFYDILDKEYGLDMRSKYSNRAVSSLLYRRLIQIDRGVFAHESKVYIDKDLLEDIVHYIDTYEGQKVPYSTIFNHFKLRLLSTSSVRNRYGLQGVLHKYLKGKCSYMYTRDTVKKW